MTRVEIEVAAGQAHWVKPHSEGEPPTVTGIENSAQIAAALTNAIAGVQSFATTLQSVLGTLSAGLEQFQVDLDRAMRKKEDGHG